MPIPVSDVKKILVIKLRAIGDVVLSTVVLPNLRQHFPAARMEFLTEKPSRQVLEGNPNIDSLTVFDVKSESGTGLIREIRSKRYDLVIDLFGNPRSALLTLFSGARYRVGYRFSWRKLCYNIVVTPRGGEVHNTEFNLDAVRSIGVPVTSSEIQFPVQDADVAFAGNFIEDSGLNTRIIVALNPGGGWYTKKWKIRQFAELGDLISEQLPASVVIIWGPGEKNDADGILKTMKSKATLIPLTDLKQLAAILSRCDLLVTNDSGPMHIAAALKLPIVAIFGPTDPKLQGPFGTEAVVVRKDGLDCLGCNYTKCPIENPCMENLEVNKVFEAVTRLLSKK